MLAGWTGRLMSEPDDLNLILSVFRLKLSFDLHFSSDSLILWQRYQNGFVSKMLVRGFVIFFRVFPLNVKPDSNFDFRDVLNFLTPDFPQQVRS